MDEVSVSKICIDFGGREKQVVVKNIV